jgi:hypothetical protein
LGFLLIVFWLVVIYDISRSGNERRRSHDKDDRKHWPLHHA